MYNIYILYIFYQHNKKFFLPPQTRWAAALGSGSVCLAHFSAFCKPPACTGDPLLSLVKFLRFLPTKVFLFWPTSISEKSPLP